MFGQSGLGAFLPALGRSSRIGNYYAFSLASPAYVSDLNLAALQSWTQQAAASSVEIGSAQKCMQVAMLEGLSQGQQNQGINSMRIADFKSLFQNQNWPRVAPFQVLNACPSQLSLFHEFLNFLVI